MKMSIIRNINLVVFVVVLFLIDLLLLVFFNDIVSYLKDELAPYSRNEKIVIYENEKGDDVSDKATRQMSIEEFIATINLKDLSLDYGQKEYLYQEPRYFDEFSRDRLNFQLTITSSNLDVIRPEPYGAVRAIGEGTSEIDIYDKKGEWLSSCTVNVRGGIPVHNENEVYKLGEVGPGGGFVFYDAGNYSRGWRYLEVAPDYWVERGYDIQLFWINLVFNEEVLKNSEFYHVKDTSSKVGMGKANTNKIAAFYGNGQYPASLCRELVLNGKDDWFLPSAGELEKLMILLEETTLPIKLSSNGVYWSSTLEEVFIANVAYIDSKQIGTLAILNEAHFRPIRAF
jgi:hypothetical protein